MTSGDLLRADHMYIAPSDTKRKPSSATCAGFRVWGLEFRVKGISWRQQQHYRIDSRSLCVPLGTRSGHTGFKAAIFPCRYNVIKSVSGWLSKL